MYIFYILSYSYIKLYLIQPLPYPFYPHYVSTSSPQPLNLFYKPVVRESYCIAFSPFRFVTVFSASILHWIAAEKVDKPVKKRFSHQEFGKSSEKRDFYIALPKKYLLLCHTLHHYGFSLDNLCIALCTYCIYHGSISALYFSCNSFFNFYYLLSQPFWFFKCSFVLYIYILWFCTLLSLRCFGSAFLYMAVFFPLFFRSFDVETSF